MIESLEDWELYTLAWLVGQSCQAKKKTERGREKAMLLHT